MASAFFDLRNAPASFPRLMSGLLQELNGECLMLFLYDVLVYSKSIEEHKLHLRKLFTILRANKLYVRPSKCTISVCSRIVGVQGEQRRRPHAATINGFDSGMASSEMC